MILLSVYGAVTRWFAPEKKGKDDQPQPNVERTIVAQSRARADFLQTSRSKGGYVATLAQLYEVLDSIVVGEFGAGISSVEEHALAAKIGADDARRAKKLFLTLSRFHDYASGEKRFLFPPVLRWRALTARTTRDAEAFLNRLGITIAGEDERTGQKMELLGRERPRAYLPPTPGRLSSYYLEAVIAVLMRDKILPEKMHAFAQGSMFRFSQIGIALPEFCRESASKFNQASVTQISNAQLWHAALAHTKEIAWSA